MNRLWILATMMPIVCCSAQSGAVDAAPKHTVAISEEQNRQTVAVHKSDDVVVTFVAAGGTGYEWQMEPIPEATAKEQDVAQHPGLPGGPVNMMFHVQLKKAGTVTLRFKFFRAWEKNTPPAKTFSVTLEVSE